MGILRAIIMTIFIPLIMVSIIFAQTGKISGRVTDAETGEPLPGVNVIVVGTDLGAATNADGYYNIINIPPGSYTIQASFIGYAQTRIQNVRVNIDLTTTQNFELRQEAIAGEEVVVEAEEAVVKRDVSANVANINTTEIENVPVAGVTEFINLQAGIEPGMQVRGSGLDELGFIVDGMSMRSGRDETPYTSVSYTSISDFQVQTGGFNAEYGNVRSGLVNIVTKEGAKDHYTADVLVRYTPPQKKYGGIDLNAPRAYWWRSFFTELPEDYNENGENVSFIGTNNPNSPWDRYMQRQYPTFEGWNAISQTLNNDEDPDNDLTPEQAREVALFRHRKDLSIDDPDYELDASIGGPVPFISQYTGDLRFLASYRGTQAAYIVPQLRDVYKDRTGNIKLTSNVSSNLKLVLHGMLAEQRGMANSHSGGTGMWTGNGSMAYRLDESWQRPIWTNHYWNPMNVNRNMVAADLTHNLSTNTFYELRIQRMGTKYHTFQGRLRDTETVVKTVGPMELDEAPFGYESTSRYDYTNTRLSGDWHGARDSSTVERWRINVDFVSQYATFSQLKTGAEIFYSHYNTQHGQVDPVYTNVKQNYDWERSPLQAGAYIQNKLEFQGMVANVGLRLDYFSPTREGWYDHDPYETIFAAYLGYDELHRLPVTDVAADWAISPRIGISFPITAESKLYFNYGHFRQSLNPQNLFVRRKNFAGAVDYIGNPRHPMPQTVAYELGYEQNLFNTMLLRLTGYYKALSNQTRNVNFESADGLVDYYIGLPQNYEDIRGFEITLRKNVGRYIRGFVNYTYMATKAGNFGYPVSYENRVQQRQYERNYQGHYQSRPIPEPFARANIEFVSPPELGPQFAGINPLGDWRFNLLASWRAGDVGTWTGPAGADVPGLENNIRWKSEWDFDIRVAKNFQTSYGRAQIFVDIDNVFNIKRVSSAGFEGSNDFDNYMASLHLSEDTFEGATQEDFDYRYIPGDDKPGVFREYSVEFVPIGLVEDHTQVTDLQERPLYYEESTGEYWQWDGSEWNQAEGSFVDQVLEDKAYIDMPNQRSLTFLNPRTVRFGVRFTF